jgi:hypothetical protein
MRYFFVFAVLLILTGCNDDTEGLSQAEVDALIAPMRAQIVALENTVQRLEADVATTKNGIGDRVRFVTQPPEMSAVDKALSFLFPGLIAEPVPEEAIGTLLQFSSGNALSANGKIVRMDTGYMLQLDDRYVIDGATRDVGIENFLAAAPRLVYESSDCSASGAAPSLALDNISGQAYAQGAVVRDPVIGDRDAVNTQTNWYFTPFPTLEAVTVRSEKITSTNGNSRCDDRSGFISDVIRLTPNDPEVTGIPNDVWDGVAVMGGV